MIQGVFRCAYFPRKPGNLATVDFSLPQDLFSSWRQRLSVSDRQD
jgi:hypothetical protein